MIRDRFLTEACQAYFPSIAQVYHLRRAGETKGEGSLAQDDLPPDGSPGATANISPRLAECTFERLQPEEGNWQAFHQCAQYPKRWPLQMKEAQGSGLLLWGRPGVGK